MTRFFLDTNVVLDFLTRREPFAVQAADLFQLAEDRKVRLYCSSLSFSQIHYILRKIIGSVPARSLLLELAALVTIVAVDSRNVQDALQSAFIDFEDALQYYAASAAAESGPEAIITRDPKGFSASQLPVLSPAEALRRVA
ncbi:type II toxin-antitoxin system VapC family toxin [Hymenobacter baengnokdamensis]|uniref:type II toxin-antitoxin system VapC family toxin n=1 Tax=Hymenobacter baengnokdamensis TaxID=2615203 RepID=UPI0012462553|nr:PIN domain-containing protein [Hymenobacter baengnokdamensis]